MREKLVYEAPVAEALFFRHEDNFCETVNPSVSVTFGGGGGSGEGGYFDEETDW